MATLWIISVESVVFGLSSLPGLVTYRLILNLPVDYGPGQYLETALLGVAFVPAYFVFCLALMFFTAMATKIFRWRSVPGTYRVRDVPWPMVRWGAYNASIHVVRLFAGGLLRGTPIWTWFVRLNGAKVGQDVHINSLGIYDHNLITLGDHAIVGSDVKMSAHSGERELLIVKAVTVGRGVTIGTSAIIQPGVVVGDGAQIGTMSLVLKDTQIPANCLFAGVPAKIVRTSEEMEERRASADRGMPAGGQ